MASDDLPIRFPDYVLEIVAELQKEDSVESIWLIGSRANRRARPDSDWDFLVFCSVDPIQVEARRHDVDIIRVGPSGSCLLDGKSVDYEFSFNMWHWRELGDRRARYIGRRSRDDEDGRIYDEPGITSIERSAYLVWSRKDDGHL